MMKNAIAIFAAVLVISILTGFSSRTHESADGKALFFANCAACHGVNKGIAGPPFQEIRKDYPHDWIYSMIRNHDSVRTAADVRSRYLSAVWHNTSINSTFQLTDEEITAILDYVDTARPVAKDYYRHRKMSNEELNAIIEYLHSIPVDTTVEVYMHIFDSVQHI